MYFVGWGFAGDEVDFDAEIFAGFAEGCVGCLGEDPIKYKARQREK